MILLVFFRYKLSLKVIMAQLDHISNYIIIIFELDSDFQNLLLLFNFLLCVLAVKFPLCMLKQH